MDKKLNITLNFSPEYLIESKRLAEVDPICSDGYLHIRFRDYENECDIVGFEQKLTYLITTIFNKGFYFMEIPDRDKTSKDFKYIWDKYSEKFLNSSHISELLDELKVMYPGLKGIKLYPNYRKDGYKDAMRQFGSVAEGAYPALHSDNGSDGRCFSFFFLISSFSTPSSFKIRNFLFDDKCYLKISELKTYDVYSKFVNRKNRKVKVDNYQDLW